MTESEIFFDYVHTMRQVSKLNKAAKKLRKISDDEMNAKIKSIKKNWQGESADRYCEKCSDLAEKIKARALSLEKIAQSIKSIAVRTYKTEKEAVQTARNRSYK